MNFIKSYWKAIGIAIVILIVLGWVGSLTGMNRKLFNMALDNFRTDQSRIVRILEETVTERERELAHVYGELDRVKQQQVQAQAETERLRGKIREIQNQRESIVVPSDPDRLVDELHRLGFKSVHRRKR